MAHKYDLNIVLKEDSKKYEEYITDIFFPNPIATGDIIKITKMQDLKYLSYLLSSPVKVYHSPSPLEKSIIDVEFDISDKPTFVIVNAFEACGITFPNLEEFRKKL